MVAVISIGGPEKGKVANMMMDIQYTSRSFRSEDGWRMPILATLTHLPGEVVRMQQGTKVQTNTICR